MGKPRHKKKKDGSGDPMFVSSICDVAEEMMISIS